MSASIFFAVMRILSPFHFSCAVSQRADSCWQLCNPQGSTTFPRAKRVLSFCSCDSFIPVLGGDRVGARWWKDKDVPATDARLVCRSTVFPSSTNCSPGVMFLQRLHVWPENVIINLDADRMIKIQTVPGEWRHRKLLFVGIVRVSWSNGDCQRRGGRLAVFPILPPLLLQPKWKDM